MEEYKKILVLKNEVEANLMGSLLAERAIPHLIKSYYDSAYDGLFQLSRGWGYVAAPPSYERQVKEIYEDISADTDRPTEGDDGPSGPDVPEKGEPA